MAMEEWKTKFAGNNAEKVHDLSLALMFKCLFDMSRTIHDSGRHETCKYRRGVSAGRSSWRQFLRMC